VLVVVIVLIKEANRFFGGWGNRDIFSDELELRVIRGMPELVIFF